MDTYYVTLKTGQLEAFLACAHHKQIPSKEIECELTWDAEGGPSGLLTGALNATVAEFVISSDLLPFALWECEGILTSFSGCTPRGKQLTADVSISPKGFPFRIA
jgi:hypothetical protein